MKSRRKNRYSYIRVRPLPGAPGRGVLAAGAVRLRCAIGRTGVATAKREGDGASPRGRLRPLRLFWRADRGPLPRTGLPVVRNRRQFGWCDDPAHPRYNRLVGRPFAASHEQMWREDRVYDLVVELDWNTRPAVRGRGSAIFLHAARAGLQPTAGCVALPLPVLGRLIARIGRRTLFVIG